MEEEELEQIPWSSLIAENRDERTRTLYLAAGVAAALLVGFFGARMLAGGPSGTTVTLPEAGFAAADPVATEQVGVAPVVPAVPEDVPGTGSQEAAASAAPISEADLMAILPDEQARAAAIRAEWFVTDLFTADLDPRGTAAIRVALPPGTDLTDLPQESEPVGVTYVEWARAFRVEPIGSGTYRVAVLFRALGAGYEDDTYTRLAPRAVDVTVAVTPDGGTLVTDLPTPIPAPSPPPVTAVETGSVPAPDFVIGEAIRTAADWGSDGQVLSSGEVAGRWRVVVSVADEVGVRWPLVLWFDDLGTPVAPPEPSASSS